MKRTNGFLPSCAGCGGSLTLEACIVVPVFVLLMLLVNGLFVMTMGEQVISHALIQSAKSLAFDPYSSQRLDADQGNALASMFSDIFTAFDDGHSSTDKWYEGDNVSETVKERFVAYLKSSESDAEALLERVGVEDGLDGISFEGNVESGVLTVNITYKQNYIFNAGELTSFERKQSVKVKLFEYKE